MMTQIVIKNFRPSSHSDDYSHSETHEHLKITVTLPTKFSKSLATLILGEQAEILDFLEKSCPPPSIHHDENGLIYTFDYQGPILYCRAKGKDGRYQDGFMIGKKHIPQSRIFEVETTC